MPSFVPLELVALYQEPANFSEKKNKSIKIGLADPFKSAIHNYYKKGVLESKGNSITEGIGQGRITKNLKDTKVDESFQISDSEALNIVYQMILEEGLILGGSSGINIAGAIKLGKLMGKNKNIVTILCDYGTKYESKIFNKKFLLENKLPVPSWL